MDLEPISIDGTPIDPDHVKQTIRAFEAIKEAFAEHKIPEAFAFSACESMGINILVESNISIEMLREHYQNVLIAIHNMRTENGKT